MEDFLNRLLKIRATYFNRMRLLSALDVISGFSIFYAVFIIIQLESFLQEKFPALPFPAWIIPVVLAAIISIITAVLLHRKDRKKNIPLLIEYKYPELKEKLRTAYDNRNESNVIVDSLKSNVTDGLTIVSASRLISSGMVMTRIILVILFIAGATMISINPDYRLPKETLNNFSNAVGGTLQNVSSAAFTPPGALVDTNKAGMTGQGDIFGKPAIAPIEGKPVDLTLSQGEGSGYTPSDYKPDSNQFITSAAFPVDVLGSNVSDEDYSMLMQKTETEKQIINNYAVERSKI